MGATRADAKRFTSGTDCLREMRLRIGISSWPLELRSSSLALAAGLFFATVALRESVTTDELALAMASPGPLSAEGLQCERLAGERCPWDVPCTCRDIEPHDCPLHDSARSTVKGVWGETAI